MRFYRAKADKVGAKAPHAVCEGKSLLSQASGQAVVPTKNQSALTLVRNSSTMSRASWPPPLLPDSVPTLTTHIRTMWGSLKHNGDNRGGWRGHPPDGTLDECIREFISKPASQCKALMAAISSYNASLMKVASQGICGSKPAHKFGKSNWRKKQKRRRPRQGSLYAANTPKRMSKSCGHTRRRGRRSQTSQNLRSVLRGRCDRRRSSLESRWVIGARKWSIS
jgi:hypothetical protein